MREKTDYTVAYADNKNVGTATVTISAAGNYSGEVTRTFEIEPKTLTIAPLKPVSINDDGTGLVKVGTLKLVGLTSGDKITIVTNSGVANTIRLPALEGGQRYDELYNYTLVELEDYLTLIKKPAEVSHELSATVYDQYDEVMEVEAKDIKWTLTFLNKSGVNAKASAKGKLEIRNAETGALIYTKTGVTVKNNMSNLAVKYVLKNFKTLGENDFYVVFIPDAASAGMVAETRSETLTITVIAK